MLILVFESFLLNWNADMCCSKWLVVDKKDNFTMLCETFCINTDGYNTNKLSWNG